MKIKKVGTKVANSKRVTGTDNVNEFMSKLEHPLKAEIEAVRGIIMKANPKIEERVKWNAPSFFYKTDLAAFNCHQKGFVQLVLLFPKGFVNDKSGLLEGDYDRRRIARFDDMKDVRAKRAALESVVKQWVKLMDESSTITL